MTLLGLTSLAICLMLTVAIKKHPFASLIVKLKQIETEEDAFHANRQVSKSLSIQKNMTALIQMTPMGQGLRWHISCCYHILKRNYWDFSNQVDQLEKVTKLMKAESNQLSDQTQKEAMLRLVEWLELMIQQGRYIQQLEASGSDTMGLNHRLLGR